jgi:iron complex outermembrane receptor protein
VTKRPSLEETEGTMNYQVANGNGATGARFDGAFGGPVTDSFGLRVNGLMYDQPGFYENVLTDGEVGGSQGYGLALGGLWDGGGMFSANGRVAYSNDEYQTQSQARIYANQLVDIDDSVAVQNGQSPTLIYTSGLTAATGWGLPDCWGGVAPPPPQRDFAIQGCGSTPKTIVGGKMPDGEDMEVVQREDPRTGGNYIGTEVDTLTATLVLEWDIDAGVISSYTGFAGLDSTQQFDGQSDALPAGTHFNFGYNPDPDINDNDYIFTLDDCGFIDCSPSVQELNFENETRLFSQEIRYASKFEGPVNFTVGALLWKEEVEQIDQSKTIAPLIPRQGFSFFAPPPPGPPPIESLPAGNLNVADVAIPTDSIVRRDTTSYSLYGLLNWDIADTVSLVLEGRWVSEELEVTGDTCNAPATLAVTGLGSTESCGTTFRGASSVGVANGNGLQAQDTYTRAVFGSKSSKFEDDFFAPKATLQWMPSDTQMFYGSIAEGIKPGGISTITAGAFFNPDENTFDKEELWAYELGSKSTLFDGSVLLNAALFFQDYTNKQVGVTRYNPITDTDVGGIENAGEAETYGIELEALWKVTDYFSLSGSYTYLDSEYTKFTLETQSGTNVARNLAAGGGGCLEVIDDTPDDDTIGTCIVDLEGNKIEDVPEHSFVGNARWESPLLSTGLDWYADASFIYKDSRYIDEFNAKELKSYWLMDFRTGLISDGWEIILFIDNVTDDDTAKSAVDFGSIVDSTRQGFSPPSPPDGVLVSMPDPRVVGIRANFSFGG